MSLAARFLAAFNPAPHIHGTYITSGVPTPGKKWTGKAESVFTAVTLEEVEAHLAGRIRLGFAPLHADGRVWFAAIDIDDYKLELKPLVAKVRRAMLPFIVCRTKSGGAHLYIFFAQAQSARAVRQRLLEWSLIVWPKGRVEIFPKQDKLKVDITAKGNWINVPYFGDATYAVDENGERLTLEAFLEEVDRVRRLAEAALIAPEAAAVELENGEFDLGEAVAQLVPHWVNDRHLLALTVSGVLLRAGVEEEKVRELIGRVTAEAHDEEPAERVNCVGIAAQAIANNAPMFGVPELLKRLGREPAEKFLRACGVGDGGVLQELNAEFALINWGGAVHVLTQPLDPEYGWHTVQLLSAGAFRLWLENQPPVGRTRRADWWLRHPRRRQYNGVVFRPGAGAPNGFLNLWAGWAFDAAQVPDPTACEPWVEMVQEVIAAGNAEHARYILGWCADAVQNPTRRPGVTLVLRGKQGVGKGTFARWLGALFGKHFLHIRHSKHLIGHFNSHLVNALLVFADEALYPGDKTGEGALKGLITEPTLPIEYKGKDVISVKNHIRVLMASNHDWIVPAGMDDRRFAVFDVNGGRAKDEAYFQRVNERMSTGGGAAALLKWLLEYDLSGLNLRSILNTVARTEQQMLSMEGVEGFVFEKLREVNGWSRAVKTAEFFKEYRDYAGKAWTVNENQFGIKLHRLIPSVLKVRLRGADSGVRHRCYRFPDLPQARQEFEAATGKAITWADWETKDDDSTGVAF